MEAALRAETALARLSRLEGAPEGGGAIPRIVPAGLLERVDLSFVGPVETLVEELAGKAGFRFERSGAPPARPVMVEVRARSRPLIMVLRDAGLQAGAAAALVVDAERGLVVLDVDGRGKVSLRGLFPAMVSATAFLLPTMVGGSEPPALPDVVAAEPSRRIDAAFASEKRASAMRAAALSFGARAGLARRGWEISRMLEAHGPQLSGIFRFRELLLSEGGFTVMPPVAAETRQAFRLGRDGAQAASARRVLRSLSDARFVSAPPDWRDYLVRRWPEAEAPVSVLCSPRPRGGSGAGERGSRRVGARAWRLRTTCSRPTWTG